MSKISTERGAIGEGDSWAKTELRSITRTLEAVRDRLATIAGTLQVVETAEVGEASGAITSAAAEDSPEPSGGGAELLLATVQCVIADRLDPAIQSLVELQQPPDDEPPEALYYD